MKTSTPAEYGAAWLDEHDPGWANRINLEQFRLSDSCRCILGQLYSHGKVNGYLEFLRIHGDLSSRLGFDVSADCPAERVADTFRKLEAEWSQLVAARQRQSTSMTHPQEVTA